MFRNSLNQAGPVSKSVNDDMEEAGDEYFEFDGAKLEIKHNATIRQSEVSIGSKITTSGSNQPSVLEGSNSLHSPVSDISQIVRMSEENPSNPGKLLLLFRTKQKYSRKGRFIQQVNGLFLSVWMVKNILNHIIPVQLPR